jgi:NAD(P)H-dependent nitrite reductase small subunit
MSDFVKVAELSELAAGQSKCVQINGREIALFNAGGKIFAIDNVCPHRGGPLSDGALEGGVVVCPWHGWRFDLTSGACVTIPAKAVDVFEVKVDGGAVWVRPLPKAGAAG